MGEWALYMRALRRGFWPARRSLSSVGLRLRVERSARSLRNSWKYKSLKLIESHSTDLFADSSFYE